MIRVVLDTNVVLAAILSPLGPAALIVQLILDGVIRAYISAPVWTEYLEVTSRPDIGIPGPIRQLALRRFQKATLRIVPQTMVSESPDPKDNIFLECAEAAKAHYLVTENVRDFPKIWKYTRVVRPGQFLKVWDSQKPLGL